MPEETQRVGQIRFTDRAGDTRSGIVDRLFRIGPGIRRLLLAGMVLASRVEGNEVNAKEILARGINMDHIFEPYRHPDRGWAEEDDRRVAGRIHEREFAQVARLGFTHVRLNLGRAFLQEYDPPCRLREEGFKLLDRVLDLAAQHRLGLVIDMHQVPVPPLDSDTAQRKGFRELWRAIGERYAKREQPLIYELLNEPRVEDPDAWREIVLELITAIRQEDPERVIIVTGGGWGDIGDLIKLGTQTAPNVVYSFHFYDPFVFTHQGATWTGPVMRTVKGIHYPLVPDQISAERDKARQAGLDTWPFDGWLQGGGKDALREKLASAFELAKRDGVILYCGEFGTHKPWSPPQDRARWITDVRSLLDEGGIQWAMWAYHAGYDLVEEDGSPTPEVVKALGLGAVH